MDRLYRLRYRGGRQGVIDSLIEVPSREDKAEEMRLAIAIGKAFCDREPGRLYIRVESAIVADVSILAHKAPEPVPVEIDQPEPMRRRAPKADAA